MWSMIWPILVVVGANTFYNISAKSTSSEIDPFASLALSYVISSVVSVILFYLTNSEKHLFVELAKANWASYVLGISIVMLEFGFICLYRAGWKISIGNLIASITLSCVLLIVGLIFFKESLSVKQYIGIAVCFLGIILIAK